MTEHRRDLARAYDAFASERDKAGEPDWRADIRDGFAARLPRGGRLLEIGAGVGYSSKWFLDQGFDVTATDLSTVNVEICRAKGLRAEVRDMADLGFVDQLFDGVWAASCLMHIPDSELPSVLEEISRVLTLPGHLWAGTWGGTDREGIWENDRYEPKRFYSIRSDERMRAFYEPQFEVLAFDAFDPRPDLEWHYQSALLRKA